MLRLRLRKFSLLESSSYNSCTQSKFIVRVLGFMNPTLTVKFILVGFGFFKNIDIVDTL
jgi:hypothetical protein